MAAPWNYYQLLGLPDSKHRGLQDVDELKKAYRKALLFYHPDKVDNRSNRGNGRIPTIDEISEAYKTLANPALRAEYDQKLRLDHGDGLAKAQTRHTGMEIVDLEEMDLDEILGAWRRPCRCGSSPAFVVTEAELEQSAEFGELITGCKGCSLWLKVLFSVAD